MPYSDQEAFLNAYLKNYAQAQQNAINSGKTGMSSARYTGQQAMNAAPTTLPDYGDIASSFTSAYTKQLAAVEAQREKEAKAAQAAAEKEARAAASAAKKASSSTTKSKKLKKEELKALDSELEEMAKTRVALQERKETQDTNTRERIKENVGDTAGISSLTAASRTFAPERKGSATKKRLSLRLAAGVKGLAKGASTYKQMQKARGGVSAEDSVDLGGVQTPQATVAKQKSRTKARASVAKQNFTTQELDARLTATNQRMRELQKQGKTKTREYRQLQNQHDTYATALGVDSFAGRAGATGLGAVSGFAAGVANMGDATARAIRGQSASMDIPEYEAASDDLQEANEQRDALIQMGRAYTDTPNGPVATPEFQQVLDRIASAKGVRAENQVTPERNQVVNNMLDFAQNQNQKAQAGLGNTGRFLVGTIGSVAQNLPAFAAAAAVPEAAPVLIPALMGASAAGNRENELEQRGVPLNQAVLRSGLSGVVSGITNKLPLEQGAELIAGNGPGIVRAMARQALSEGGQEASEYAADYGLDVLAGDPDANFSLAELGQQALGGALGGAISAAGSSLIGSGVNRAREAFGDNGNAPVDTDVQQAEPVSPSTETAPQQPAAAAQDAVQSPVTAAVEAFRNGTLTNQQLDDLKPGGALRSEFEAATGMTLPETSSATRNALKAGMQEEIPYLRPVDSAENTGYDGTNETYTGGASDDGTGRGNGKIAEPNGEGREGIPELLRDAGNSHGAQASEGLVGNWNPSGGTQVLRGFLNVSPETQAAVERSGATPLELRDTTSDPQLFSSALEEARQKNPHGLMVSPKTVEELSQPETRTFMSADNMAGALVTADGDIEAVFKNPQSKAKQAATSLLITAVENGGRKLDCYGEGLVRTYNNRGFEAVARIPFNAEEVEAGWTYGKRDVYVMKLRDGVTAQDIANRLTLPEEDGGFHQQTMQELANLPVFDDYDEALAYRDSLLTTPAETGNIPELMPTANQSVQEPIPTLADHPNTVGSMESAFDAPEAPTRDINTQRRILDGLDDQRIKDLGPLDQDTHTVYTDEKARYDARQQMDLAYQEALQQGQDPSQAIQTALDTEMARLRGQEGAWNKTDRYTADVIQEELKRQWQNVEPGSDEYLVAQARYSAWASEERERASEAGRNLQANAGRLTGNSVTEKAQNMVHKIIGAYADKELSNGTKKQLSEFADDLAAEAEQLFGEGRQDLTSGMDTVSRMDKAAARVKELAQKYKVSITEEQQRRLAASMLAGDKSESYYDRLLEFASGIEEIDLDTLERVDNYIYQMQGMPDNKERYTIEQRMYWELAQKLYPKAGFMDKVASWRYLCMLGNVRTHMRNLVSNVLMDATTRTKDTVAAVIEAAAQKIGVIDESERTKAILNPFSESDKALRGAAYKFATENMYSELSGGRYSFQTEIQRARQVWKNKGLEWLRNASSDTLGEEDRIGPAGLAAPFLESDGAIGDFARKWTDAVQAKGEAGKIMLGGKNNSFASAMAQYLKAHGYDASVFEATDEKSRGAIAYAAAYAKQEAFRATFAEANETAKWLNSAPGGAKLVVDALDPFAKTSGNVFKQGLRYSPVGLLNGLKKLAETSVNQKRGRGTVYQSSEIINSISEGLTGSAIMVLGGWLASMGVLRATGKEEEKGLDTAEGKQDYSFQIGNHNYTMDWTTPASMPLIMGASLYENGVSIDNIITAAASLGDPVLDTMMLQSVQDTIDTIRYSGTDGTLGTLGNLGVQVGSSYAGQFVPTALGQVARSVDDTRRDSYGGGDSSLSRSVNRFIRKQENKIPFLSETNEPYVDVWGNERKNAGGNFAARLAFNTISPGFYSTDTEDETGRALRELAETTGNAAVLPSRASSSIDYNGGHYRLSPEEYTTYLKTSGQTAKYFADAITQSNLDPSEQEELIPQLYNVAKQIATQEVRDDYVPSTTYQSIMQLYNALGPDAVIDYKLMRLNADTNDNGRISKDEATAYLDHTGWSQSKKSAFLTATNKGWKNPYD
uniref:Uncharacterized protein n=1 Tax=Ackermannviridae sp. ctQad106 TaxID=2826820 RepID=A0A8S5QM10_9CAUD|nr:MAG TPA: hypothetical protein [Ackermannviridae sp. ctQad106]